MEEYIVTLRSRDDLDEFYEDMETPGGSLHIPDRKVDVAVRREFSANTHYYLTAEEAETLKKDPRVIGIEPRSLWGRMTIKPSYTQTSSNWEKDFTSTSNDKNWGLLRCVEGSQRSGWGYDSTSNQSGNIKVTSSGKNVDVVIVDGHFNPNHPEFAVNADGTGGSRVVQYNWFQHNLVVNGNPNGTYIYPPYIDNSDAERTDDNNHGIHVAATVAGNTQGWARDANIYNINPYGATNINGPLGVGFLFDYILQFHLNKPINPETGRKNPTIVNNSWASFYTLIKSDVTSITWRGVTDNPPFTDVDYDNYGLVDRTSTQIYIPAWTVGLVADVINCISEGIIFVGAAGNESMKIDSLGGQDYNNTITESGFTDFYHRGSWNVTGGDSICVGAASALVNDSKATFSNPGSRVNLYAPGNNIMSAIHEDFYEVTDPRNALYKLTKYSGTSMASPQVCGILACLMEQCPRLTQSDAISYLEQHCKLDQMTVTTGGYTDTTSLQGGVNRYLYYNKERKEDGVITPRVTFKARRSSGQVWPRRSTYIY
jgi:hypothetical protein